jgi:hypothetical protein
VSGVFPEEVIVTEHPDVTFSGFSETAFDLLESLRQHPHIEQYRKLKPELDQHLVVPFKQYRDDLAVNWVLPNALPLETERNVFSRLLKNDFGAGGCHHHLWMSFYRKDHTRLRDLQFAHNINPDGFTVGVYAGRHAPEILDYTLKRVHESSAEFAMLLNSLLEKGGWSFNYDLGKGSGTVEHMLAEPLTEVPANLRQASGVWIYTEFPREQVAHWRSDLVLHVLKAIRDLWPVYRFLL